MIPRADKVPMPTVPSVTGDGVGASVTSSARPSATAPEPTVGQTLAPTETGAPVTDIPPTSTRSTAVADSTVTSTTASEPSEPSIAEPSAKNDPTGSEEVTQITAGFSFQPTSAFDPVPSTVSQLGDSPIADVPALTDSADSNSLPEFTTTSNEDFSTGAPPITDGATPDSSAQQQGGDPAITAPGLSILASALTSIVSNAEPSFGSAVSSIISQANSILDPVPSPVTSNDEPSFNSAISSIISQANSILDSQTDSDNSPVASTNSLPTSTAIIATIGDEPYTIRHTSNHIVMGSATLSAGQETTISGVPIAVYSSALLIGSTFIPVPGQQSRATTSYSDTSREHLPPVVQSSSLNAGGSSLPSLTTASASASPFGGNGGEEPTNTISDSGGNRACVRSECLTAWVWMTSVVLLTFGLTRL